MGAGKGYFTDYPKHVAFILGNEFCERFSFYGMKAILVIFLTRALKLSEDEATSIYHGFNMACYFTPLLGAMLADGFLGHYKTIFSISIVYAIGNVIMAVGAIPFDGETYISALPYVGLTLIAIGTGGIKPCVAAFGADQFEDHQMKQKETFFSMFYMSINVGSLMSMIITPIIRSNVTCFGDECYPLAFGIPAILMVVSLLLFVMGTRWYKIIPPGENILGKMAGCIYTALKGKCGCSGGAEGKKEHWLDYADSKYDKSFIADVKAVMHVLFIFIPFPMFNALYDQQGSRWTLQAGRMDGDFGSFVIEPDLIQVANPIMVVIMVPVMETFLFPCFEKFKIPNSPLQRLGIGMFLAAFAFVVSGLLQIAIDNALPTPIRAEHGRFKVINALPCDVTGSVLNTEGLAVHNFSIPYTQRSDASHLQPVDVKASNYTFRSELKNCVGQPPASSSVNSDFLMTDQKASNIIIYWDTANKEAKFIQADQPISDQTGRGAARLQFFNAWDQFENVTIRSVDGIINGTHLTTSVATEVPAANVEVWVGDHFYTVTTKAGGVYSVIMHYTNLTHPPKKTVTQYQDITPNSVNILLMLPQYFVMVIAEVFFQVTGLSFAYSQSPPAMKAVLQASWLLTSSLGNLIVMIITAIGSLPNQMAEFFMYAGLMFATSVVYVIMALSYEYVSYADVALPDDKDGDQKVAPPGGDDVNWKGSEAGFDNLAMVAGDDEIPPTYDTVTEGEDGYTNVHF